MIDREKMTEKANKYCSILLLIIVAVTITYLSYQTIWLGDDIKYQYSFANLERNIDTISDVIESQNTHYCIQNGRYLAHTIVQTFCGILGQPAFAFANGVIYILFFLSLFRLCDVKLSAFKSVASIIILSLLSLQTNMMPSCQVGYIWMITFTMGFLTLFFKRVEKTNWAISILCGLISIIIGNGQEALNFGVSVALLYYWYNHRKEISILQYCMMIGFWIGTATDCLSPGTLRRGGLTVGIPITSYIMSMLKSLIFARGLWFMIIVVLYYRIKHKISFREIYRQNTFYWVCLFALIFMDIVANFQYRAGLGIELTCIIIGIRTLSKKSLSSVWLTLCSLLLIVMFYYQSVSVNKIHAYYEETKQQYSQSKDGKIYVSDLDFYIPVLYDRHFAGHILPYGVTLGGDSTYFEYRYYARRLKEIYPGKPYPLIMPTYLKGKDHVDLGNQLIYLGDSLWLAIQSKSNPAQFEVVREVPILSLFKDYPPVIVNMADPKCVLAEGDNWRARFISEHDYAIHGINFTKELRNFAK